MKLSGIISLVLYPFFEGGGGRMGRRLGPKALIVVRCTKTPRFLTFFQRPTGTGKTRRVEWLVKKKNMAQRHA